MKKRFSALLLVAMLALLTSCGGVSAPAIDSDKPWGVISYAYERTTYTVEVFSRVDGTDSQGTPVRTDGDAIGLGSFTQTLSTRGDQAAQNQTTVTSKFSMQWSDDARAAEHRGLYDEITSRVEFYTSDLSPISSEKTAQLASRGDKNNSYTVSTDYQKRTVHAKSGKSSPSSAYLAEKEFSFQNGLVYDNEQLFYLVRAFSALHSEGNQVTFPLASGMDLYEKSQDTKTPAPASVTAGVLSGTVRFTFGDFILDYVADEDSDPDDADTALAVDSYTISVSLNQQNPGPSHRFVVSKADRIFTSSTGNTSKLVVGYDYFVFDQDGLDQFRIAYRLTGYTTDRTAV